MNGNRLSFCYDGKEEYVIHRDRETTKEKVPIGTFLIDFLNFDLDMYRYGIVRNENTDKEVSVNYHDFRDFNRQEDGAFSDDDVQAIRNMISSAWDLPDILYCRVDEFIDLKRGIYIEEEWEKIKHLQNECKMLVNEIFEVGIKDKVGTPRENYVNHFKIERKNWKRSIPNGEMTFHSLVDCVSKELYFMAEAQVNVYICGNCGKYSIGSRKAEYCERDFKDIWGYPEQAKTEENKDRYNNEKISFIQYLHDMNRLNRQQGIFYEHSRCGMYNVMEAPKIKKIHIHNVKEIRRYIKKMKDKIERYEKELSFQFRGWISCRVYANEKNRYNIHPITTIKNMRRKHLASNYSKLLNIGSEIYIKRGISEDLRNQKEKRARELENVALNKEQEYIQLFDNASSIKEKEVIVKEYEELWLKAISVAKINTDINGNKVKREKRKGKKVAVNASIIATCGIKV